jgi:hypothetical protein
METMRELKQYLKDSAVQIRELKKNHKDAQRKFVNDRYNTQRGREQYGEILNYCYKLNNLRKEYRHHHIAYSELRGRPRNRIESSYPYDGMVWPQRPDEHLISKIKEKIKPV